MDASPDDEARNANEENSTAETKQEAPPPVPAQLPITPPGHQQNAKDKDPHIRSQLKPRHPSMTWLITHLKKLKHVGLHEWVMVFATVVMALSTLFYSKYAKGQLATMQDTLTEMKRSGQTSTDQMWAAVMNLNWAARSMDQSGRAAQASAERLREQISKMDAAREASERQSKAAIKESDEALRIDQRAWVWLDRPLVIQFIKSENPKFQFWYRNSGKTPALDVLWGFQQWGSERVLETIPPNWAPTMQLVKMRPLESVPPQAEQAVNYEITDPSKMNFALNPTMHLDSMYDMIKQSHTLMYFTGIIKYKDVFRKERFTQFCVYLADPDKPELNYCPFFSDIN